MPQKRAKRLRSGLIAVNLSHTQRDRHKTHTHIHTDRDRDREREKESKREKRIREYKRDVSFSSMVGVRVKVTVTHLPVVDAAVSADARKEEATQPCCPQQHARAGTQEQ